MEQHLGAPLSPSPPQGDSTSQQAVAWRPSAFADPAAHLPACDPHYSDLNTQLDDAEDDQRERTSMAAATRLLSANFSETALLDVLERLAPSVPSTTVAACVGRLSADGSGALMRMPSRRLAVSHKRMSLPSGSSADVCNMAPPGELDWFYSGWQVDGGGASDTALDRTSAATSCDSLEARSGLLAACTTSMQALIARPLSAASPREGGMGEPR